MSGDEKSEKADADINNSDEKSVASTKSRTAAQKRRDRKKARKKAKSAAAKQATKPSFKGGIEDLGEHVFVYNAKERVRRWMRSRIAFINYAGSKHGKDVKHSLVLKMAEVISVPKPTVYTNAEFKDLKENRAWEYEMWKMQQKVHQDATAKLTQALGQLFSKLWGQCDDTLKDKIMSHEDYKMSYADDDVIKLLTIIDEVCGLGEQDEYIPIRQITADRRLQSFKQGEGMTLPEYHKEFTILADLAEKSGNVYSSPTMIKYAMSVSSDKSLRTATFDSLGDDKKTEIKKDARELYLAAVYILNSSDNDYAAYKQNCHNSFIQGQNIYPKTISEANSALARYKFDPKIYQQKKTSEKVIIEHGFLNTGDQQTSVKCYNCDRIGHYSYQCEHDTKADGTPTARKLKEIQDNTNEATKSDPVTTAEANMLNEASDDESESGTSDYLDNLDVEDYKLTEYGFYTDDGELDNDEKTIVTVEDISGNKKHILNQGNTRINPSWILLDNCSSVNVFYNPKFLTDIREVKDVLHLYTNAGKAIIRHKGTLKGFGRVWYHKDGIANILSYHKVAKMKGVSIRYDNKNGDDAFYVSGLSGTTRKFIPSDKGLYHWKSQEWEDKESRHTGTCMQIGNAFVETIADNKKKFTQRDVKRAEIARRFQHTARHLSIGQLYRIVSKNQLLNCPITPRDVRLMKAIFGPSIPGLKGKTVRKGKPHVEIDLIPLPKEIKEYYQLVTMGIDVMYVNKIPFLMTISRDIHYGTATPTTSSTNDKLLDIINQIITFYYKRGFRVHVIVGDGQFKSMRNDLAKSKVTLNCTGKDEHTPEVERYNRTVKERCRCVYNGLPFNKLPKRLVCELVRTCVYYLNAFPWEAGVSKELSPTTIVTGLAPDYKLHFNVEFGSYAQIRDVTTNTMKPRTLGAIATMPTDNHQGGMRFFTLNTGHMHERAQTDYVICPMPEEAKERIERMSRRTGLLFEDRNHQELVSSDEDEEDDEFTMDEASSTSSSDSDESDSDHDDDETIATLAIENTGVEDVGNTGVDYDDDDEESDENEANVSIGNNGEDSDEDSDDIPDEDRDTRKDESDSDDNDSDANDDRTSSFGRRLNTGDLARPMDDQYEYQYIQLEKPYEEIKRIESKAEEINVRKGIKAWNENKINLVNEYIMTQFNLQAGLKEFGHEGKEATMKELRQMLTRDVFREVDYSSLTNEDKERALPILLFLTRKRDGRVKGRACADGRKQRVWTAKEDSSSPTIAPEALFYTLVVDALEGRDVATCDLPGHFLQTDMDERLVLRINGALAKLLVKVDPGRWSKHLHWERGRPVIYVLCNKAIYGTITAALLSYKKLIGHLTEWGFEMNPYEPCCWNKDINGKQATIVFHVDDLKLSHLDPNVVTEILNKLEKVYATIDPMTKTRGKVHQYLGMTIDFRTKGEVRISMYDYIKKMIDMLPTDMKGSKPTAAAEHLFKTDDESGTKLDSETSDLFHSLTAMSLYLGKRARPDLQPPTAFLCTRVQSPDEHDWKKLSHMMKYLQNTRYLPLILRSNNEGTAIYIDGSHATHADMKGHAGAMTTEGKGSVFASSTKLKINTLSSTETEVVATGEKLPKFVWYRNFRIAQGTKHREDILYQDNQSAILLNRNGRMSAGKGSKHIAIRYFFITDRIAQGEFRVEYCPTEEMIADYFTKPLQGSLFRKFRDLILGIHENEYDEYRRMYIETLTEFGLQDEDIQ